MDFTEIIRLIHKAGFPSVDDFIKRRALPILFVTLVLFIVTLYLFLGQGNLIAIPFIVLVLGIIAIPGYAQIGYEVKSTNIQENIHLFITYISAISTTGLGRVKLFDEAAKREEYGEITKTIQKILYLAKDWGLGFTKTCRMVSNMVPSRILSEFLDRLSTALDFGEDIDKFLRDEQYAVMDEYEIEYKKALKLLDMLQDIYSSLLVSAAFVVACAILLPFVIGYPLEQLLIMSFIFLITVDAIILVFVECFIPKERICHNLSIKAPEHELMITSFKFLVSLSIFLFVILFALDRFSFPLILSISITPLGIVGYLAGREERAVIKRDNEFSGFIRSLGGSLSVKGGALIGTLHSLRIHDFGALNECIERLYRRLKLGTDKMASWKYFAGESGSMKIHEFCSIFADVDRLGGDPEVASKIISDNFTRLMDLRKLRLHSASSLRGVFYGSLVALAGTIYGSFETTSIITGKINAIMGELSGSDGAVSMVTSLFMMPGALDIEFLNDALFIIIVVQAAFTAYLIKIVDGGSRYYALFDLSIMVWVLLGVRLLIEKTMGGIFAF